MPLTASNGAGAAQDERAAQLRREIEEKERALILEAYAELKKRGDGELRVAVKRDPRTGCTEIIYCGVHQKGDLDGMRELYARLRQMQPVTFGR